MLVFFCRGVFVSSWFCFIAFVLLHPCGFVLHCPSLGSSIFLNDCGSQLAALLDACVWLNLQLWCASSAKNSATGLCVCFCVEVSLTLRGSASFVFCTFTPVVLSFAALLWDRQFWIIGVPSWRRHYMPLCVVQSAAVLCLSLKL